MASFYNTPQCAQGIFTVGDVLSQLQEFNAAYEASPKGSVNTTTGKPDWDENYRRNWRTQVREGVIHCENAAIEFNFFENMISGGTPRTLEATEYHTKYDCFREYNIAAESDAAAATPGGAIQFTMARAFHSLDGKHANIAVGGTIYIYESRQMLRVTAVDPTSDYAHIVTAYPHNKAYQASIKAGRKMMFNPVRHVDGHTCAVPTSTWRNPGYFKTWKPFRVRKDWEMPYKIDGPYNDIMQFHFLFDSEGNEVDGFEAYNKTEARRELQAMKNLDFFIGQKIDNPALLSLFNDDQYTGFEGLLPILRYGGGGIYDFDPALGFDIQSDFEALILQQDSTKRSKEFMLWMGINFHFGMTDRWNAIAKNYTGACTFETFVRSGAGKGDIEKLMVNSIRYGNYSIHSKVVDAWSDSRYLGNYDFPNMGILQPGTGLVDSKGASVPAVEFFNVSGKNQQAYYEGPTIDHMKDSTKCEKLSGTLIENYMMAVHCPGQWVLLNPTMPA